MREFFTEYFKEATGKDVDLYDHVDLDECVVSRIINNNRSLPKAIVNILLDDNYEEKIKLTIDKFIKKYIDIQLIDNLINQLKDKILKAENINEDEKEYIKHLKIKIEEEKINFICEAFKITLNHENKIDDKAYGFYIKDIKKHFTFPLKAISQNLAFKKDWKTKKLDVDINTEFLV